MQRSILALAALVAFAIGSSAAYADCAPGHVASTTTKQTVASVDGAITPKPVTSQDGGS